MTMHRFLHRAVLSLCLLCLLCLSPALLPGAAHAAGHAVDGKTVTLALGHTLDQRRMLDPADFTVTASGAAVGVLSVSFTANGEGVALGLARAPSAGAAVEVRYTWPWSGEGLWTASGDQIDSFSLSLRAPGTALTAAFHGLPAAHDGSTLFGFELRFSEVVPGLTLASVRSALSVTGGRLVDVRRTVQGKNDRMTVRTRPDGDGDVTLALAATADCSATGAICARGGKRLAALSATVPGPADTTPPLPLSATAEGSLVTVTFDEDLTEPATTEWFNMQWTIDGTGLSHHPNRARLSGLRTVSLDISTTHPAAAGQTVTVGYWASDFLRDAAGNRVADFSIAAEVPSANAAATGAPTISGTARVGETLTASTAGIADADGLTNATFAHQWVAVRDGTETDISGATASTYTLADTDAGAAIRVRVRFTDDAGNAETLMSAATAPVALPPLTAEFLEMPAEHDGARRFEFGIRFSEEIPGLRLTTVRAALRVTNGRVVAVKRAVAGQNRSITVQVRPDGTDDVTVSLPATADCAAAGAICTRDGRRLVSELTATVRGPVAISVADARANEADDAIAFTVSLSRAASGEVTVDYATRDGTAKAGEDYTFMRGTLSFAAGEMEKTVNVPILDDALDEGEETFTLKLMNARGAAIGDGEATGTIENSDPLQQMWLSRFGRTVAGHVTDAVSDRLANPLSGAQVTIGGQPIDLVRLSDEEDSGQVLDALAGVFGLPGLSGSGGGPEDREDWLGEMHGSRDGPVPGSGSLRRVSGRDLLLGSSFHLAAGSAAGGPGQAAWGRVTAGGFDGEAPADGGTVRVDGEVITGILGADAEWDRLLAGVAISASEGEGTFDQPGVDSGTIDSTMTTVSPYARYLVNDRLSVWGLAGFGTGDMTVVQAANDRGQPERVTRTDLEMRLAALGGRGALLEADGPDGTGGMDLTLKAEAFFVETESEAASQEGGTTADASRMRLVLEGSKAFDMGGGAVLTPGLELGLRHDGGDAETGTGVELGGRVSWNDPGTGLVVEARVRALVAHEDSEYEEWGASGSVRLEPGERGRGLSFSLAPTWGAASSGVDRLWGARDAGGLAPGDEFTAGQSLQGEIGYGLPALGGRFTGTPNLGFGFSDGARDYRIGWRLTPAVTNGPGFEASVDATRKEAAGGNTPEHAVLLRAALRW